MFLSGTSRAKISRSFEFIKVVKESFWLGWSIAKRKYYNSSVKIDEKCFQGIASLETGFEWKVWKFPGQ